MLCHLRLGLDSAIIYGLNRRNVEANLQVDFVKSCAHETRFSQKIDGVSRCVASTLRRPAGTKTRAHQCH